MVRTGLVCLCVVVAGVLCACAELPPRLPLYPVEITGHVVADLSDEIEQLKADKVKPDTVEEKGPLIRVECRGFRTARTSREWFDYPQANECSVPDGPRAIYRACEELEAIAHGVGAALGDACRSAPNDVPDNAEDIRPGLPAAGGSLRR